MSKSIAVGTACVLHSRMSTVCADLPSQDSGLASCLRFLQSAV
jgi:hypothetical protein